MADVKISALPASTTPLAGTEILPIVQSATTRQVSVANLTAGRAVSALSLTSTNDASISGLTVGKGGGAVASNTAVGATALTTNTTGDLGTAVGFQALYFNNARGQTGIGYQALKANTSGTDNTAVGRETMLANISGAGNTAIGTSALAANTSASYNTAVGFSSASGNLTGIGICAIGAYALSNNNTGQDNTAVGSFNGTISAPLFTNTTGSYNVAIGTGALRLNLTASNNTAVGYQAGYTNSTGQECAYIGGKAGYSTTGGDNTFVGYNSGNVITSGYANTIIGKFTGNSGGLDIRTANNYIVLSDGSGNPRGIFDGSGNFLVGTTVTDVITNKVSGISVTPSTTCFRIYSDVSNACAIGVTSTGSALVNWYYNGANLVGSVTTNGTGVTYGTASDYRLKENIAPMTGALAKVAQLKPVTYKWKSDGSDGQGFIAHELQAVVPDCVNGVKDALDEDGNIKPQSVDTSYLVATLVAAIKELKAEVDALKTQIGA